MLYNRLQSRYDITMLFVILITLSIDASSKKDSRLSPIPEEEENYELGAILDTSENSDELIDVARKRAKSLDLSQSFLKNSCDLDNPSDDMHKHDDDMSLEKMHYNAVILQLKERD